MQALYENTNGTYSVGVVVGRGLASQRVAFDAREQRPTVQVRFVDTDENTNGRERVESLFVNDPFLTLGVLQGSMCSALTKHAR